MIERIRKLCEQRNIKIKQLEYLIGLSNGSINHWRTSSPKIDNVALVADYFGVSLDYIYGRDDYLSNGGGNLQLSHTESDIIKKARSLDENGLETVLYIIDSELRRMDEIAAESQKSADIIPLWRSLQPASAGRGFYLSADEFETIIVRKTDETKQAAFCVPVSGDSMEPLYYDGDILLVGREKTLSRGQIGIFTVDGKGYVKKLDEGVLVSLNADYPDIPMTDETYCNGNVIGTLDKEMIV